MLSLGDTSLFQAPFGAPAYNLIWGRAPRKIQTFIGGLCISNRAQQSNGDAEMIEKVLERSVGKTVLIKVRGGRTLRGTLEGFDQHVNLYMSDAEEVSDMENVRSIGTIVLRGDNVIMLSPPPE